jgi:hypothetical protein
MKSFLNNIQNGKLVIRVKAIEIIISPLELFIFLLSIILIIKIITIIV